MANLNHKGSVLLGHRSLTGTRADPWFVVETVSWATGLVVSRVISVSFRDLPVWGRGWVFSRPISRMKLRKLKLHAIPQVHNSLHNVRVYLQIL